MKFNNEYVKIFNDEYSDLKPDLSDLSITMINTMKDFIESENTEKKVVFTKKEALVEVKKIKEIIDTKHDYRLDNKLNELLYMIENDQFYIDSLIKLECALGMRLNSFFYNRAQRVFFDDIFKPIIWHNFEDEYLSLKPKKK